MTRVLPGGAPTLAPHDAQELPGSDLQDQRSEEKVGWLPLGPQEQVREPLPDRTLKPTPGGELKAARRAPGRAFQRKSKCQDAEAGKCSGIFQQEDQIG